MPESLAAYLRAFEAELDYVYRTLRRHGVRPVDAEDLAQEVFLIAWRRWSDFDQTQRVRPWLAGIAFNVAHQHFSRRRPEISRAQVDLLDEAPLAEERLQEADARALVLDALARLPERHRSVLVMHELDGLSVNEITALSALPRFTVYSRLRRARRAFARAVQQLQRPAGARDQTLGTPAMLLAFERRPPAAPAELRRRLRERLPRQLPGRAPLPPAPPAAGKLLVPGAAIVGLLGGLALLTAVAARVRASSDAAPPANTGLAAAARARTGPPRLALSRTALSPPPATLTSSTDVALAPPAGLARDLVGYWSFDEAVGSATAQDRSGNGHHCVLRNLDRVAAWVPGAHGRAIHLGFNGWLECTQPALPRRASAAVTVAAWVKRAGNPRYHHAIAMRPMGAGRSNYFFFGFVDDRLKVTASGWEGTLSAPVPADPGSWMHVAFTHGADRTTRLYIDGVEVGQRTGKPRRVGATDRPLIIGAGLDGRNRTQLQQLFEGTVDELLVFERALREDEIRALATGSVPPTGQEGLSVSTSTPL